MRQTKFIAVIAVSALISGCAPKAVKNDSDRSGASSRKRGGAEAVPESDINAQEASLRGGEFTGVEGVEPIYFDYDSSVLKEEALNALKKNAAYLKENKEFDVRVAGYCDERGTVEYNLALGQKRARSVREYYVRLGVSAKRIATISYGKEALVCTESTEACWAKNRRAETQVRASTAQNAQPSTPVP